MLEADAAEARGDAAGALALLLGQGRETRLGSVRSPRVTYLRQLATLGCLLPGWVVSRWVLAQALQSLHRDLPARRTLAAQVAVDLRVQGETWTCQQLFLHELGGLEHFLTHVASPDLLARADSIDAWVGVAMGGYRLVAVTPRDVTWCDVGSGTHHVTDNVGSAVAIRPGEHTIGRLVPTAGRMMFEARPLPVDAGTAWRVAVRPDDWLEELRGAGVRPAGSPEDHPGGSTPFTAGPDEVGVLHDVPRQLWAAALGLGSGADVATATLALGQQLLAGAVASSDDRWACLAAALLEPSLHSALASADQHTRDALARLAHQLADQLADPAGAVCRDLAAPRLDAA